MEMMLEVMLGLVDMEVDKMADEVAADMVNENRLKRLMMDKMDENAWLRAFRLWRSLTLFYWDAHLFISCLLLHPLVALV